MQLHNELKLTLSLIKEEKIESRRQSFLRKQQFLCNVTEVDTPQKYLSLLEYFQMYHVFTKENEKNKINPFTYSQFASNGSNDPGRQKSP